jgi:DNA helicase II / ATP-dependent DNA helicase PcrA
MKMKLNDEQQEAVDHVDGPCIVTATPGSGKTRILTERTCVLIKKGISPKNILCLTFTNKASGEMSARICKKLGTKKPGFFIGTFHSFCANFLKKTGDKAGYSKNFTILDGWDQKDILVKIARDYNLDINASDAGKIAYVLNYYRDQLEDASFVRDNLHNEAFVEIVESYIFRCKEDNLIDFSGLIFETIKILEDHKDIRDKVQEAFKYILVDEVQDTNQSQFHLVNLLGGKWKNIMIVGDQDQGIYRWRGARSENLQEFINRYKDCKVITLSKNYRSTPQIIKVASNLIKNNLSHENKKFETDNKNGQPVRCYKMGSQIEEAQWLARYIKKLRDEGGWDYSDMTVLCRMNKQTEPIEQAFVVNEIPYDVIGSGNFYDRKEVKYCLSMLKLTINPLDYIAFAKVCQLVKGLGNVTIGKIEKKAKENNINLIESCGAMAKDSTSETIKKGCKKINDLFSKTMSHKNPAESLNHLVQGFDIRGYLDIKYSDTVSERIENVEQVIESASNFNGQENATQKYLQRVALVTANDKEVDGNRVSLMTLHASKGLEFPIIFIVGVENNILPHERAVAEDPIEGRNQEINLFYVGITRAEKLLYLTYCERRQYVNKFGKRCFKKTGPSEFLYLSGLLKK